MTLNHVSLFSGYCGFELGLKLAGIDFQTVLYVEIDDYCQKIIQQRVRDGVLNDAPIWPDVRTLNGYPFAGKVGLLTAGFPCQPYSHAGRRKGAADERDLWLETLRVIREMEPGYVLLENVDGLTHQDRGKASYAYRVIGDLASIGYDCIWHHVPAAAVGAPHLRWRWWCIAYPTGSGCSRGRWPTEQTGQYQEVGRGEQLGADGKTGLVADTHSQRRQQISGSASSNESSDEGRATENYYQPTSGREAVADSESQGLPLGVQPSRQKGQPRLEQGYWWEAEPDVGRVVDGCSARVDRLRTLGNGIVPAVVAEFLKVVG